MRNSMHSQWVRLVRLGIVCLLTGVLAVSFSLQGADAQRRGGFGGGGSFGRSGGGGFGGGSFSGGGGSFGRSSSGSSGSSSFGRSGGFGSNSIGRSSSGSSFGRSGGYGGGYSYTRSAGGGGYYGGRAAYGYGPSYYWGSPMWYYYTPFHPAFYYNAPYIGQDGAYYGGGFNFMHFLISVMLFFGVIWLLSKLFFGRKNVRYTSQ